MAFLTLSVRQFTYLPLDIAEECHNEIEN